MAAKKKSKTAKKPAKKAKTTKKAASRKPAAKSKAKASKKKSPARKAAPKSSKKVAVKKKSPAKKKTAAKKPVKKASRRKGTPEKPIIRTGPSISPRPSAHLFPAHAPQAARKKKASKVKAKKLTKKELEMYKELLLRFRDRVIDEISFLANDNLNRNAKESSGDLSSYSFHMADQGTDNYDREFAASLLNNEHDVLYEIEEALRRIEQGTYGICEISEQPIERERLKVLPFARYCVAVQSEIERTRPRNKPFSRSSIQGADGGF